MSSPLIYSFLRYSRLSSHTTKKATPIFKHAHSKTLLPWICITIQKDGLFYQLLLETWPILEWPHPFFGHAKPKKKIVTNFYFSWICINMIKLISSFFSGDVVEIKNMQSGCPRAFWCIYQETNFSQIWNLCRNKAKT